ncbi:MAG: ATP-dependent helicase, partial [Lachnospiraceae bacterium]|nr:ATP-dependent helicase [Lachnospiraceae bacterium]
TASEIEDALLYLSKIEAIRIEGGFLVLYNALSIKRLELDNKIKYKKDDYKTLNEYYQQKIQMIHIVGEYANMMAKDYQQALQFVNDYFQMDYKKFLAKYFSGDKANDINRNITPSKYKQLFGTLSDKQLEIINDNYSKNIVVAAGPGSGKTRVLVHKLASLLLLADVKHEQLLMLTFSRAAAIEFKDRLHQLIGNAAHFIEIKTFHSYCFDLLGKIGNILESKNVVEDATKLIIEGESDFGKITKSVLVIDEAQDMDEYEYTLVKLLIKHNEEMRVIAVGDDDQNIYKFRGSDSKYLKNLLSDYDASLYSLLANYRSSQKIVEFSNHFVTLLADRMKTDEIYAVSQEEGEVGLYNHTGNNIEEAVVNDLLESNYSGTSCILTDTNKEALIILGMLMKRNVKARLIQSMDYFDIYDIAEIRYFLKLLKSNESTPIISDKKWAEAKEKLASQYADSACLYIVNNILKTYEKSCSKKYFSDFEIYLHESKLEDFYEDTLGTISISTMHKSKGREFDNIFMLINKSDLTNDEEIRKLYVAMTRAKHNLHIHYKTGVFDKFSEYASFVKKDANTYPEPEELILQLTHRDVVLDSFKNHKRLILGMRSGNHLMIKGDKLIAHIDDQEIALATLSKKCKETINKLKMSGYTPYDAVIRYICAWRNKNNEDDNIESAVILADLHLHKR